MTSPQQPTERIVPPPLPAPGAATTGNPVNVYSRAVDPRLQYPQHFQFLYRDFSAIGVGPQVWKVIAADAIPHEDGELDVEFTLLKAGSNLVRRRRVVVRNGRLMRITEC
jgi:hypothetical protein